MTQTVPEQLRSLGAASIEAGRAVLGIEFGSTRIKAVLIDGASRVLGTGSHEWASHLADGLWSYDEPEIWVGLRSAYRDLAKSVEVTYGVKIRRVAALGISAMMHGYIALDASSNLLVPFRTWRNANTDRAARELSENLQFNMPHRWSAVHLYQAAIDQEPHVPEIKHINTLAGYVHERLSGRRVLGVGDASGMFPIDPSTKDYDEARLATLADMLGDYEFQRPLRDTFPKVLVAGEDAGELTAEGASLIDPSGTLQAGMPMCPPEGDAGTGMVATNSVAPHTGNVSAGTSIFAMVVLDHSLSTFYPELDVLTTPAGAPVAMVHSNNGTSEWDQWVSVFDELLRAAGAELDIGELYGLLYNEALKGAPDGGGLLAYNFLSGEPVVGSEHGRPLFLRTPSSEITLATFMRVQLMSVFGVLRLGMDVLREREDITLERLFAHGGLFKTPFVSQTVMASALNVPVEVSETAGEGGAWGIALLAKYRLAVLDAERTNEPEVDLPQYLDESVFEDIATTLVEPTEEDVAGFNRFLARYVRGLPIEESAVENS